MKKINAFRMGVAVVAATATLGFGEAQAASQYDLAADMSGSRTVGNGLTATGSQWDDIQIDWQITLNGGVYSYQYTITDISAPALSHLVLDITPNALRDDELADPDAFVNPTINGESWDNKMEFNEDSFPQEDGITGGVKFDEIDFDEDITLVFEFDSNRAPVWGHIVLKGGQLELFNTAYGDDDADVWSNTQNFIARPNGSGVVVPLPAAAWGGLVLLGALGAGQRFRKRRMTESV